MHFLFTFYSCTKSYLIFNEKYFEQDFLSLWKITVLLSLLTQSELFGIYISGKFIAHFWLEVCLPVPLHRLRKTKQLALSQDNWLWEAVTPSFRKDFRPPEDLLTLLLAKCYVKALLKPLSSVFSGKTWKYCKHLVFVFSLHVSLYSRHTTTSSHTGSHVCMYEFSGDLYKQISVTEAFSPCSFWSRNNFRNNEILWTRVSYIELQIVMILKYQQNSCFSLCSATDFTVT